MSMSDEPESLAEEVERLRAAGAGGPVPARDAADLLPSPPQPTVSPAPAAPATEPAAAVPSRPDGAAVNESWDLAGVGAAGGLSGRLQRWIRRLMRPLVEAQTSFNARQVQLDNQLLEYVDARFDATHRHYDQVLGLYGRHLQDADRRHVLLEKEVVTHVHDLVKRIDLVLAHGERTRVDLESSLRMVRARLEQMEERLVRVTKSDAGRDC
jgi:hypothetical protein